MIHASTNIVAHTNSKVCHTSLYLASQFVAPLIPQFELGYSRVTNELITNLNVCMYHEWTE